MEIKEMFEIKPGVLVNRIKEADDGKLFYIYNKDHFNNDKEFSNNIVEAKEVKVDKANYVLTKKGDIIIDSNTYEAVVVMENQENLLITFNYFLLENIKPKLINNYYFINWFNSHPNSLRQLEETLQGTRIKKLSRRGLENINVDLINIEEQEKISNLYKLFKQKHNLYTKKINYEEEIIKNMIRGDYSE